MKVFYEWGRNFLRRIELITQEDTAKKPEIPQGSSIVRRLKAASDRAHEKRKNILNKWGKRHG